MNGRNCNDAVVAGVLGAAGSESAAMICAVIDFLVDSLQRTKGIKFHTVRGAFLEGAPLYPGSSILREIQIAVRDPAAILGTFKPNFMDDKR
jgi:hypothetical protein